MAYSCYSVNRFTVVLLLFLVHNEWHSHGAEFQFCAALCVLILLPVPLERLDLQAGSPG